MRASGRLDVLVAEIEQLYSIVSLAVCIRNMRYNVKGEITAADRRLFDDLAVAVDAYLASERK